MPSVESLLQELELDGDETKRILYQDCQKENRSLHRLQVALSTIASSSLLDLVQNKPDVEADLRRLRKQGLEERGGAVYIPPQAKANL
ncbi:hypothetical protein BGZ54_005278 [Gamsiella multidivaricata]|nr:hypothetical protein BGZ54_005278 [Gamsiella multidivaricata]